MNYIITKDGSDANFLKNFYFYMGSDTTPPCEEMVERYVMMQYLQVSDCLLDVIKFSSHI
jgi:carbonic anhydrase